jgi:hypothetical protein
LSADKGAVRDVDALGGVATPARQATA